MGTIHKKLHSTKGASMMIALLFLLVSTVIGSLILTAATANASKVTARYEEQRQYFAVSSAARLLKGVKGRYTYTMGEILEVEETGETDPDTGEPIFTEKWTTIEPFVSEGGSGAGDILTDAYSTTEGQTNYNKEFDIVAQKGMPPVHAVLNMDVGGDARIVLSSGNHTAIVSFTARTSRVTDEVTYKYFITSWSEGHIEKGED